MSEPSSRHEEERTKDANTARPRRGIGTGWLLAIAFMLIVASAVLWGWLSIAPRVQLIRDAYASGGETGYKRPPAWASTILPNDWMWYFADLREVEWWGSPEHRLDIKRLAPHHRMEVLRLNYIASSDENLKVLAELKQLQTARPKLDIRY